MYPVSGIRATQAVLSYRDRERKAVPEEIVVASSRGKHDPAPAPEPGNEAEKEAMNPLPSPEAQGADSRGLTEAQLEEVKDLAARDREVRAHEAAHQAAAGDLGGGASFEYKTGPDGKSYAVGGEVPIDMSNGRTPEETIRRAEQVQAAALAPADPSPQDMAVAAAAARMEAMARQQQMQQMMTAKAPTPGRTVPGKPEQGAVDRPVDSQHFQAIASVYAERATQVQSTGSMQRLASKAITAYSG